MASTRLPGQTAKKYVPHPHEGLSGLTGKTKRGKIVTMDAADLRVVLYALDHFRENDIMTNKQDVADREHAENLRRRIAALPLKRLG